MKNHREILKQLKIWHGEPIFRKMPVAGGQTNFIYFIEDKNGKYVAHFAHQASALLDINKTQEINNTKIATSLGLGPKFIKYYPQYRLIILEYIEGQCFKAPAKMNRRQIKLIAKALKKLHNGPKFSGRSNPFNIIKKQVYDAKRYKVRLPDDIDRLLKSLAKLEKKFGTYQLNFPCHFDLVVENLVWTGKGVKIIDWEYSTNSDYRIDLATVSNQWNFNKTQDKLFFKEYGDQGNQLYEKIQILKPLACFREAAWGLLQQAIRTRKDIDYKKYAADNLNKFKKLASKII